MFVMYFARAHDISNDPVYKLKMTGGNLFISKPRLCDIFWASLRHCEPVNEKGYWFQ